MLATSTMTVARRSNASAMADAVVDDSPHHPRAPTPRSPYRIPHTARASPQPRATAPYRTPRTVTPPCARFETSQPYRARRASASRIHTARTAPPRFRAGTPRARRIRARYRRRTKFQPPPPTTPTTSRARRCAESVSIAPRGRHTQPRCR